MDDTHKITRDIYGMPAFVTLAVADLERTVDWYVNGLDFVDLFRLPGLAHLRRWRYQDILVRTGAAPAQPGEWTYSVMADVEDLEALAERARAHGGGRVEGPADTPWNTRDVRATDPDGYTVIYTARRAEGERDPAFTAMMQREAARQLGI
jgi:catechol 2,3-dioxygenase-like lactoylglutathione lyase family enzyme